MERRYGLCRGQGRRSNSKIEWINFILNTKKKKSTEDGPNCLFTLTTCSNKSLVWGPINRSRVIPIRWDKYKASPFRALIRRLDPQIVARWESRRANTAEEIEIAAQTSTPEGGVTRYSCSFALPLFFCSSDGIQAGCFFILVVFCSSVWLLVAVCGITWWEWNTTRFRAHTRSFDSDSWSVDYCSEM